jgi:hypothetical protein
MLHWLVQRSILNKIFVESAMQFWEYLFREDQRLDLADWSQAERLNELHRALLGSDAELPVWPAGLDWRLNFLALRTLARYLKGKRLKRDRAECLPTGQALAIQHDYIRSLCVVPVPSIKPSKVVVLPTLEDGTPVPTFKLHNTAANAFRVFWQSVFLNMLGGEDRPVCQRCGKSVSGTTPKGRKRRRTFCDDCYWKRWREKQTKGAMRKRWREAKKDQKENLIQEQQS